jgi:hypothetical protein
MPGQIVHFEIPADDTAKGREFWGSLFGWQFEAVPGPFEYHMTRISDQAGLAITNMEPVGCQNSAMGLDLAFYALRSYSLIRPPRTGRRLIRSRERSAAGWSGRGGRSWRLRWGRRPL